MAQPLARTRRAAVGYTLVELMVVLALTALLAGLAAPSFRSLLAAQRMRSASAGMVSDLLLARSEALKRGGTVQVVPSAAGWVGGWRVLLPGNQSISQHPGLGGGVQVTRAPGSVSFDRNGRVIQALRLDAQGREVSDLRFAFWDGAARHRCVLLAPSGRPQAMPLECPQ